MAWTCPACERTFARTGQSHECAPAMSLDEYLATGPPHEPGVVEAVLTHVQRLGPVHVEPVSVGVFLKNPRTFCQLRPRDRWEAVSFSLRRRATHPTIVRKVTPYNGWFHHVANVRSPDDLDDELLDLLTEAYHAE